MFESLQEGSGISSSISEHIVESACSSHTPRKDIYLPSEVKVQWGEGFELGQGIDAITGARKPSALLPFTIPPERIADDHRQQSGCRVISSITEIFKEDAEGIGASINVGLPEKLGMSMEWSSLKGFSGTSTIMEHYLKGSFAFEQPLESSLKFTPEAQALLQDPKRFRECYGDYFICGYQRQYRYHVIVSYQREELTKESNIGVNIALDSVAYGGLNGTLQRTRKENHTGKIENFFYVISGISPDATKSIMSISSGITEDNLLKILQNVQTMTFKGVRQVALLRHYSNLCPRILPSIITEETLQEDWRTIFSEILQLDRHCLNLDFNLYHPAVQPELVNQVRKDVFAFRQNRESLVHDASNRRTLLRKLELLDNQAQEMISYSTFIRDKLQMSLFPASITTMESLDANAAWKIGIVNCEAKTGELSGQPSRVKRVNVHENLWGWEVCFKYVEPTYLLNKFKPNVINERIMKFTSIRKPLQPPLPGYDAGRSRPDDDYAKIIHPERFYTACHSDENVTILGFTMTFNNKNGKKVRFNVSQGGLLHTSLAIQILDIPRGCECHCRITYIEEGASRYGLAPIY